MRLSPVLHGLLPRVMVKDATRLEQAVNVVAMRPGKADDRDAMMIARMRHVMMILQLMRTRHRASSIGQRGVN